MEGAVYDKATNTITLTNYNHPEMTLATNEMGDDLKLHLVGDNHIAELVVWGFGWGGNLRRSALWPREHRVCSRSAQTLL